MKILTLTLASLALAAGPTIARSQTPPPKPPPDSSKPDKPAEKPADKTKADATAPAHHMVASKDLLGLKITNDAKKDIGEIGDLIVDPRTGEIRYAVLEIGGTLGIGEDMRVVPWKVVKVAADEKDPQKCAATTTATEQQLKAAPTCSRGQKLDMALEQAVATAFGKAESTPPPAPSTESRTMLTWLSKMPGVALTHAKDGPVGKVQELVVAPQFGAIAYAVVETTSEAGGKEIAVPFERIEYGFDAGEKLVAATTFPVARFAGAPQYDAKDKKRMTSSAYVVEISKHFECEPFWKSTRAAAAKKPVPAPG